jgi:anhydro-N-acetylmuramic acid kinase
MASEQYFIGILSGTSMDAVDTVLADFSQKPPALICTHSEPLPDCLHRNILALCEDKPVSLRILGETDINIGKVFAEAVNNLLIKADIVPERIIAIGSHGQTVQHQPEAEPPFTLQLGDPNTIAELTGITTVADFRRKDVAAGGQGAPLTPVFHQAFFACEDKQRVVLNLGGIANISILNHADNSGLKGFDTGPANVLMDSWIHLKKGLRFDADGDWAAQGSISHILLTELLNEPYLHAPPPKSTGRELFNLSWLERKLENMPDLSAVDVQATLLEYTAQTVCRSIMQAAPDCSEVIVCGGGAHNGTLMNRLQEILAKCTVLSTDAVGLAADWVEAMAFAWLAEQTMKKQPVDCSGVTGARHACILGGVYYSEQLGLRKTKSSA